MSNSNEGGDSHFCRRLCSFITETWLQGISQFRQTYCFNNQKNNNDEKINEKNFELILIDDASNDSNKTLDKCKKLQKVHSNIVVIHLQENKGQAAARNEGLKIANGEYIGFMDADDTVSNNYLENIFVSIKKYDNPDIVI